MSKRKSLLCCRCLKPFERTLSPRQRNCLICLNTLKPSRTPEARHAYYVAHQDYFRTYFREYYFTHTKAKQKGLTSMEANLCQ